MVRPRSHELRLWQWLRAQVQVRQDGEGHPQRYHFLWRLIRLGLRVAYSPRSNSTGGTGADGAIVCWGSSINMFGATTACTSLCGEPAAATTSRAVTGANSPSCGGVVSAGPVKPLRALEALKLLISGVGVTLSMMARKRQRDGKGRGRATQVSR